MPEGVQNRQRAAIVDGQTTTRTELLGQTGDVLAFREKKGGVTSFGPQPGSTTARLGKV